MIFKGSDGILLYGESHLAKGESRGSLLVVHGIGEHLGRYMHVADWALKLGLDVHLLDQRGHGRSQGIRGHTDDFSLFSADLESFVEHLESTGALKKGKPCFLLGHSMGGLIALDFLTRQKIHGTHTEFDGLILSAPVLGLRLSVGASMQALLADALPGFLRTLQFPSGIQPEMLTHDEKIVREFKEDPLVHTWITPSLFMGLCKTIDSMPEKLKLIDLPVLFLIPGRDNVVSTEAAEAFANKLSAGRPKQVKIRRFHSFYHEVLNEKRRDLTFREMTQWIQNLLPKKKKDATKKSSSGSSGKKATGKAISL